MKYIGALFFCLILLSACSFKSLVVPNLDYLLTQNMTKHMSLSNKDKKEIKKSTQQLLEKSKPLAQRVKHRIAKLDIQKAKVKDEFAYMGEIYYLAAQDVNVILSKQIAKFNDKQKQKFFSELEEENEEIKEKLQKRDLASYLKRYSYFFGDLSEKQIVLIKKNLPSLKELSNSRLINRRHIQARLKEILKLESIPDKEQKVLALFNEGSDRRQLGKARESVANGIQSLLKLLSAEQIKKFDERKKFIISWIDSYLSSHYSAL